jgi:serine/threonine protein kinase
MLDRLGNVKLTDFGFAKVSFFPFSLSFLSFFGAMSN